MLLSTIRIPWFEFKNESPEPAVAAADPATVVAFGDHRVDGDKIEGARRKQAVHRRRMRKLSACSDMTTTSRFHRDVLFDSVSGYLFLSSVCNESNGLFLTVKSHARGNESKQQAQTNHHRQRRVGRHVCRSY